MTLTVPLSADIEVLRQKAREGELSLEEMKAVIARVREGRMSSAAASKKPSGSRIKVPLPTGDELLDDLDQ